MASPAAPQQGPQRGDAGNKVVSNASEASTAPVTLWSASSTIPDGEMTKIVALAYSCIMNEPVLQRKWLTDDGIFKLIKQRYSFDKVFDFEKRLLNQAASSRFEEIDGSVRPHAQKLLSPWRHLQRHSKAHSSGIAVIRWYRMPQRILKLKPAYGRNHPQYQMERGENLLCRSHFCHFHHGVRLNATAGLTARRSC